MNSLRAVEVVKSVLASIKRSDLSVMYDPEANDGGILIDKWVYIEDCQMEQPSLKGPMEVPGYRVYSFQTVNNYPHSPDDVDEVEVAEARSLHEAVLHAVSYIQCHEAENRFLCQFELDEMKPVEE